MRISRKDKKKVRVILLCYTGNVECRKSYSKEQWHYLKKEFVVWFRIVSMLDRKNANKL